MADSFTNLYEVLEVPRTAGADEIREAVKTQRKTWVQRTNVANLEVRQAAERKIEQIATAERVLLDPSARRGHDDAIDTHVEEPPPPPIPESRWTAEAEEAMAREDWPKARWLAQEATKATPGDPAAWDVRGRADAAVGELQDSIYSFERAIDLAPENAQLRFFAGMSNARLGKHREAARQFGEGARLQPEFGFHRVEQIRSLVKARDYQAALALAEPLAAEKPKDSGAQRALAFALSEFGLDHWSLQSDDRRYVTSKEQAEQSLTLFRRAASLQHGDRALSEDLQHRINLAEDSLRRKWTMSPLKVIVLFFLAFPVAGIIDLVLGAGLFIVGFLAWCGCMVGIVFLALKPGYAITRSVIQRQLGHVV